MKNQNFLSFIKESKNREVEILSELVQRNENLQEHYFNLKSKSSEFKLIGEKEKISFVQSIIFA